MTDGHGVSLKPCSEVNYTGTFRKTESVIDNLVHWAQLRIFYDHEWLEGRECTSGHYKKLTNS